MTTYKIDNKIYTLADLKEGYKIITGLENVEDFNEEELFEYMKSSLCEKGLKDLERIED